MHYLLLRGGVLVVLLVVPGFIVSNVQVVDLRFLVLAVALIVTLTTILGNIEWTDCEREHRARIVREAGDHERLAAAIKN
jgi:dipeptide/tripeptide permease